MKAICGFWGLILLLGIGCAQQQDWTRLYFRDSRGVIPDVAACDSQSSIIAAGRLIPTTVEDYDAVLVKYSSSGQLLWDRQIGNSGRSELPCAIAIGPDNSIYLAMRRAQSDPQIFLQRWSSAGTLLWQQFLNPSAGYDDVKQMTFNTATNQLELLIDTEGIGMNVARLLVSNQGAVIATHLYEPPASLAQNEYGVGMIRLNANTTVIAVKMMDEPGNLFASPKTRLLWMRNDGVILQESLYPLEANGLERDSAGNLWMVGGYWNTSVERMQLRACKVHAQTGAVLTQWDSQPVEQGDYVPDVMVPLSNRLLISAAVQESFNWRAWTGLYGADGALLGTGSLSATMRRPIRAIANDFHAAYLLMGNFDSVNERWKPVLQTWRYEGGLMLESAQGGLGNSDEEPVTLVHAPDKSLYLLCQVTQSDSKSAFGIIRLLPPARLQGQVQLQDYAGNLQDKVVEFTLEQGAQTDLTSAPLDANGNYALTAKFTGAVSVRAYAPGWLAKRLNVGLGGQPATLNFSLINGDATRDNRIDDSDLLEVLFSFGMQNPPADLNGDGQVDDVDLLIVLFNFGLQGD